MSADGRLVQPLTPAAESAPRRAAWPSCACEHNCACGGDTHAYFDVYKRVLLDAAPKTVQEWGPGPNTMMALAMGAAVISIEHAKAYRVPTIGNLVARRVDLLSAHYTHIEAAELYFVDGRRRADVLTALAQTKPMGLVCLHDAQRKRYHAALQLFPSVRFLCRGFAVATFAE